MIEGNKWLWPIEWDNRFEEVTNVPMPNLLPEENDKTVQADKKGRGVTFSIKEACVVFTIIPRQHLFYGLLLKNEVDGLNIKSTSNVLEAAGIWDLKVNNFSYYRGSAFCLKLLYGDGSGISDWSQESLMIQRKKRKDYDTKRGRHFTSASSSSAFDHPSFHHHIDDDNNENDEEKGYPRGALLQAFLFPQESSKLANFR
nr:hypothetical protein [Tanacetum cinerariifolium]